MSKVVIIDYQLGNMFSVLNACLHIGMDVEISADTNKIMGADAVILPGVGAFGDAMQNLKKLDLINPIKDFVATNKPFLGVCLGLQLLFEESEEFGANKGLGLVKGVVKKFPNHFGDNNNIKVPQISWNTIAKPNNVNFDFWKNTPLSDIPEHSFMYFVHSFFVEPSEKQDIATETTYENIKYCSAIKKNNIFATQFHPEKSAKLGLQLYKNWFESIK